MFTIELYTKTTTVGHTQIEGLAPRGTPSSVLYTKAHRVAQAVTALHQREVLVVDIHSVRLLLISASMLLGIKQLSRLSLMTTSRHR